MDIVMKIKKFISYWYVRYLLTTELYMVEPWEKAVVHVALAIMFALVWYFNYSILMNGISQVRNTAGNLVELL